MCSRRSCVYDFHDRGRYIFLRVPYYRVNPIKSRERAGHTRRRLVSFPITKLTAKRGSFTLRRRLISTDPNNKRDPNDRARGRIVRASLAGPQTNRGCWNFRFYTRCRAVHFAEADPLIGRTAPSSSFKLTNRHWRSVSSCLRHVTFSVCCRKEGSTGS